MRRVLPFALLLLMAACGGTEPRSGPTSGPGDGTSVPDRTSNPGGVGTLIVTQEFDLTGEMYIEGSLSYVRVAQNGDTIAQERIKGDRFQRDLPPGTYTVTSFQRPCSANCGNPSSPTDRCSTDVTIGAGDVEQLHVTVHPSEECEFGPPAGGTPSA